MTLGFNPAAVVWHHRRISVRAYLKQQLNYGKAEAMLEGKWPEKYNSVGHVRWKGRLYGQGKAVPLFTRRSRIYHGVWGSGPFQSIYGGAPGMLRLLSLMPEWYLLIAALVILTLSSIGSPVICRLQGRHDRQAHSSPARGRGGQALRPDLVRRYPGP